MRLGKGLRRVLVGAAVIIGAELIWLFAVSPCMPLSSVEINAFPGIDRAVIVSLAGIQDASSWFTVDAARAEHALEAHYRIETARVIKRFPDRVKIFITPRTPVAMTLSPVNGRMAPVYFDRGGMIIHVGSLDSGAKVPILSGVIIEQPVPGMRLPAAFSPLLENIEKIGGSAPELLDAVSEIRINRKPFDGFDLVLYPVHNLVRVRLEPEISEEILRYVMLMIDVFESRDTELEEIDFRTGTASYTVKEAPSGE
jgi:cell division protein FtsQ